MRRTSIVVPTVLALIAATAAIATRTVAAQPAAAIGRPLPDGNLPKGTISVRIVAGSPSSQVVGADVTMLVNGVPRVARTDAAGRATFGGLPAGAMVQAKIIGEDKKETASETFPVPDTGGARLMLSTKPFQGAGGLPSSGGMGRTMPEAREMSGQPRPDRSDPAGTFVVRLTYNNLVMKDGRPSDPEPPVGVPVRLVGYAADDSVKVITVAADAEGHARFVDLDTSGATAYFALAALPRNGGHDRLVSMPTVLDTQGGARVVLSGDKRSATTPAIDDFGKLIPRDGAVPPAGKVRITLDGVGAPDAQVTLYDAATMKPIGVASAQRGTADPTQVRGTANYSPRPDLPAGTVEIEITGGMGTAVAPLPGIEVRLIGADDGEPIAGGVGTTGTDGKAKITIPPDPAVKAVMTINGKPMFSSEMELRASGGKLDVTAQWPSQGRPEAVFDVAAHPGQVVFAQTTMSQQVFRSLPFSTLPDAGMQANIYVYPRTLFTFDTHSWVEDQLLAVQGTFEVTNYSWAPYQPEREGLLIKLPRSYKGAIVAAVDQAEVAVQGEGFRILRPIPPGGRKFRAGYSMPIDDGTVDWRFELPLGTWGSEMKIRQTPGMTVKLPPGVAGETQTASTGEPWFVITNITVVRGQSIALTIEGFPTEAAWRVWAPRLVGVLVLLMVVGGLALAIGRSSSSPRSTAAIDRETRRATLLDELVELDKRGATTSKDRQRREHLFEELERLWGS